MNFPQYRKYKNNKHFFKIVNENEFDEISFIGSKMILIKHTAKILPDRNFIFDLINDVGNTCEMSSEEEYNQIVNNQTK